MRSNRLIKMNQYDDLMNDKKLLINKLNTFFKWLESEQNQSNRKGIPDNQKN